MARNSGVYSVMQQGFHGYLYKSEIDNNKAVIVMSGSEGGIFIAKSLARIISEKGYTALVLAHHKTSQTPKKLSNITIDYIENAICQLKEQVRCF